MSVVTKLRDKICEEKKKTALQSNTNRLYVYGD